MGRMKEELINHQFHYPPKKDHEGVAPPVSDKPQPVSVVPDDDASELVLNSKGEKVLKKYADV